MDILFTIIPVIAAILIFIGIWKVVTHPANWTNDNPADKHKEHIDPWTYLRYRNPPY